MTATDIAPLIAAGRAVGLNAYEAEMVAWAGLENAGDVPADDQQRVAVETVRSYLTGEMSPDSVAFTEHKLSMNLSSEARK